MIPSLQEGAGDEEDRVDEVEAHSDDNAGTDTPLATEAQEPIEGLPSSERDGAVSPAQADESVQEVPGYYSVPALAQKHGVSREALDQRLRRFRNKKPFGFKYIKDESSAKPRTDPIYVYLEPTIMHHIKALKPKRQTKRKPPETLDFGDP